MTRKDYILIAEALNYAYQATAKQTARQAGVHYAAEEIAFVCKRQNERFSSAHFLAVVRGERDSNSRPKRGEE